MRGWRCGFGKGRARSNFFQRRFALDRMFRIPPFLGMLADGIAVITLIAVQDSRPSADGAAGGTDIACSERRRVSSRRILSDGGQIADCASGAVLIFAARCASMRLHGRAIDQVLQEVPADASTWNMSTLPSG